jgi:hypothetical protein
MTSSNVITCGKGSRAGDGGCEDDDITLGTLEGIHCGHLNAALLLLLLLLLCLLLLFFFLRLLLCVELLLLAEMLRLLPFLPLQGRSFCTQAAAAVSWRIAPHVSAVSRQSRCRLPPLLMLALLQVLQLRHAAVEQGPYQSHLGPKQADDAALAEPHPSRHQPLNHCNNRLRLRLVARASPCTSPGGGRAAGAASQRWAAVLANTATVRMHRTGSAHLLKAGNTKILCGVTRTAGAAQQSRRARAACCLRVSAGLTCSIALLASHVQEGCAGQPWQQRSPLVPGAAVQQTPAVKVSVWYRRDVWVTPVLPPQQEGRQAQRCQPHKQRTQQAVGLRILLLLQGLLLRGVHALRSCTTSCCCGGDVYW